MRALYTFKIIFVSEKCDAKIDLLPNLDLPNSDFFGPPLPPNYEENNTKVQYIEGMIKSEVEIKFKKIASEPSSNTCEQRGYGRFKCDCGRSWGSSFSYVGYAQTCFTCGEDVQPKEITQISYDKKQTKRRFKEIVKNNFRTVDFRQKIQNKKTLRKTILNNLKPQWRRFSHSYQFCEACKLNQCAWRPEEFRFRFYSCFCFPFISLGPTFEPSLT